MDGIKVFLSTDKPAPKAPRPPVTKSEPLITKKDIFLTLAICAVLGAILYYENRLAKQAMRIDVLEKDLLSAMKVVKIIDAEQQETRAVARETERRFDKLVSALERLR